MLTWVSVQAGMTKHETADTSGPPHHAVAACYHSHLDPALVKHQYNECSKVFLTVQVFAGS